jgi:hypothetical protein
MLVEAAAELVEGAALTESIVGMVASTGSATGGRTAATAD